MGGGHFEKYNVPWLIKGGGGLRNGQVARIKGGGGSFERVHIGAAPKTSHVGAAPNTSHVGPHLARHMLGRT